MPRFRVLLTVTTYPLPSRSYDELVCTAGILEDGSWIRIYPVPLSFLIDLKTGQIVGSLKYTWIEIDLVKRTNDFRPESYSPKFYDFRDIEIGNRLGTEHYWQRRKDICLQDVYTFMTDLIQDSHEPQNKSLASYRPKRIISMEWEKDEREWKDEWKALRKQGDLFAQDRNPEILIPKLPYKFFYKFEDGDGKIRRMMIEDWEIGALYWNCLTRANGSEQVALEKVKQKYETQFVDKHDIHFFLGTTMTWHRRRGNNPFVIIGVFYPLTNPQPYLF